MSKPTRHEMLTLALGVLPPPPMEVEVLSEDGGAFTLKIVEQEGELLHAFAPHDLVRKELHLLARVTDEARGRYEVEFEVDEAYFHSGAEALVHAAVSGVRHRKMRRSAPRIPITERAQARVLFCRSLPRHQTLDVRLSDVSTTGIGFTAAQSLDAGDLLVVSVTLAGRPVDIETRVVRIDPAPYGRIRVGGEITELPESDRRLIADLALRLPEAGSEAERRNGAPAGAPTSP
jgi:PilZ domain